MSDFIGPNMAVQCRMQSRYQLSGGRPGFLLSHVSYYLITLRFPSELPLFNFRGLDSG